MGCDSIRFLHLSDTHFGVHYALKPRNLLRRAYSELFFRKVEEVIREAILIHKIRKLYTIGRIMDIERVDL